MSKIKSVIAIALALTVFTPQMASAATCDSGRFCIFVDANFGGDMYSYSVQSTGTWINLSSARSDVMSSWINNTNRDVLLAENVSGGGIIICADDLNSDSWVGSSFNDLLSSFMFTSTTTYC